MFWDFAGNAEMSAQVQGGPSPSSAQPLHFPVADMDVNLQGSITGVITLSPSKSRPGVSGSSGSVGAPPPAPPVAAVMNSSAALGQGVPGVVSQSAPPLPGGASSGTSTAYSAQTFYQRPKVINAS